MPCYHGDAVSTILLLVYLRADKTASSSVASCWISYRYQQHCVHGSSCSIYRYLSKYHVTAQWHFSGQYTSWRFQTSRMLSPFIGPTVAPQSCKMSGTVDPSTQHNIPKDFHVQQHCCENLKSCNKPLGLRTKFHLSPFVSNYILSFILNMTGSKEFLFNY
jgi:hypothetical protein